MRYILESRNVGLVISSARISYKVYFILKNIVVENLYLFFNLKHKHLVICFTAKGKPFDDSRHLIQIKTCHQLLCSHGLQAFALVQHGGDFC